MRSREPKQSQQRESREDKQRSLNMSRGQTWSSEEVQALMHIWSEEYVSRLLLATHKNSEVFRLFSEKMAERGFHRSLHQCRIKVKKLRQQYVKIRESLTSSGSSDGEREKFVWYDELDGILGTRPSSPKHVVESFKEEGPPTPEPAELLPKREEDPPEEEESRASLGSPTPQEEQPPVRWVIPGAQERKRKSRTDRLDSFLESCVKQQKQMDEADQKRNEEDKATFENFIRVQQEAEACRFKAIQDQQQTNNQVFLHMMGTFAKALLSKSQKPPAQGCPTTQTMSPDDPPAGMANLHNVPPPQETSEHPFAPMENYLPETMAPCTSSLLQDVIGRAGDLEMKQDKDERSLHGSLPVVSSSFSLSSDKDVGTSPKCKRQTTGEPEISSPDALSSFRDEDELFLLSLLPSLKRLPVRKRMEMRLKFQQMLYAAEFED
ncbi:uncharacterized protein LOC133463277 isoform X1 [Cololabis saira]|uniref:uncharacterized protein LOC133463277 isoform X1 n=1 Tax=Cololabis saira TaxID=129043 RepID=UPI002AD38505|nr:uncharacterized protein LOC133463277 isoform X1 [Cololabis saira]